jgi:outer membrane protein assembly factor BamD (BamD/ComL family)
MSCVILLQMEQYEQAALRLNTVAMMYQDRPEALDALIKMTHALRVVGRDTEAQMALRRAEVLLNQLEQIGTITDGAHWRNLIQGQARQ